MGRENRSVWVTQLQRMRTLQPKVANVTGPGGGGESRGAWH